MTVTKVNKWTTEKGAKVEMHTEHKTEEKIGTDDWTSEAITKNIDQIKVREVIINGNKFSTRWAKRSNENGRRTLDLGNQKVGGKEFHVIIPLPQDIETDVWGQFDARMVKKEEAYTKNKEIEIAEMKKKIANGYCPKCDSYCHGDC